MIRAALPLLLLAAAPAAAATAPARPPAQAAPAPLSEGERAERMTAADELIADSGVAQTLDKMIPGIIAQILPALSKDNDGREAEIRSILTDELTSVMKTASPAIIENTRKIYVENFTAAEMREMLAFNRSPTGRKVLERLPDMQLRMMAFGRDAGQAAVATALPRIIERLKAADLNVPTTS